MLKVTRSFSRTKQVAQFEPFTALTSYTIESEEPVTQSEIDALNKASVLELEEQMESYLATHSEDAGVGIRKLAEMVVQLAQGKPNGMDEYQNLSAKESILMNEVKKALYRTEEHKNKKSTSTVENQENRK